MRWTCLPDKKTLLQDSGTAKDGCPQIDAVASLVSLQQSVKLLEAENRRLKFKLQVRFQLSFQIYFLDCINCLQVMCMVVSLLCRLCAKHIVFLQACQREPSGTCKDDTLCRADLQ